MTFESTNKKVVLIYPDLSYKISGVLFKVHNKLGRFFREIQYGDLLEIELKNAGLVFEREKVLPIQDISENNQSNKVDFLIENKILLDIKAKKFVTKEDHFQMQRYLTCSNLKLGFIANFRNTYVKPQRVIN
ncbi:MAG: GxxExxY protein, partial [Candidatus Paceibacterales bacterium]